MKEKPLTSRKTIQNKVNKRASVSLKTDKLVEKKPFANSATPNPEAQDSNKAQPKGFFGSLVDGSFFWEIVVPVGVALFSIIFFITQWVLSLFFKNALEVIWLTVAFLGIGGATTGWFWKKTKISAVIGAVIGAVLALACVTFLEDLAYRISLGPCNLGC